MSGKLTTETRKAETAESAIARANELYQQHLPNRDFLVDVMLFLRAGCVINFPDLFAMFRPVRSDAGPLEIADLEQPHVSPDAWNVWLLVSTSDGLGRLPALLPYRLPWICFYRKWDDFAVMKRYATERLLRRLT